MFGLTLRERAAEALRRGARAAMTGAYFHHSRIPEFKLNEEASAWLYTEALAHQIYALGSMYGRALVGKNEWATPEFFFKAVGKGLGESEREQKLAPNSVASFVLKRFLEMEELSAEQRKNGEHFRQSFSLIQKKDSSANSAAILKALEEASTSYFQDARRMFDA